MENKEAFVFIYARDCDYGEGWSDDHDQLAQALTDYASIQCAEMKEELESCKKEHFETVEMAAANLKELQEEVERLRGVLGENKQVMEWHLDHSVPFLLSDHSDFFNMTANAIEQTRQALSGKESKTDK